MTKQKLIELSTKIENFILSELGNENTIDVAAATIFILSYFATLANEDIVLPESLCMMGLIELDKAKK